MTSSNPRKSNHLPLAITLNVASPTISILGGITIDQKFSWTSHVNFVASKAKTGNPAVSGSPPVIPKPFHHLQGTNQESPKPSTSTTKKDKGSRWMGIPPFAGVFSQVAHQDAIHVQSFVTESKFWNALPSSTEGAPSLEGPQLFKKAHNHLVKGD